MIERMKSFEYHVGGQPVRVIVDGVPSPRGGTQTERAAWFARHADRYRRGLLRAPRGHDDMTAVLLTESSLPDAHAGLVFLDADGYPRLALHGVMAAARAAAEHGLIFARSADGNAERRLAFDTPAGLVTAAAGAADAAPRRVVVTGVPSYVLAAGVPVSLPGRSVPVDVAFGGEVYALVDGEAAGVVLEASRTADLRRLARAVCAAVNRATTFAHPLDPSAAGVAGVVFTGPARDESAHLRTVVVSAAGAVDWSPGGSATSAVLAVLDAIGVLAGAPMFVHEGLSGALVTGRVVSKATVGDREALVVEVEGELWPTGEQTWLFDHDDPFVQGLAVAAGGG